MAHTCAVPDVRDILAANLARLIDDQRDRGKLLTGARAIARASRVSKNTILRMQNPEPGGPFPTLDKIEAVARAFGLKPFQLLTEGLDPSDPPKLMTPAVARELEELRAMRVALQQWAHEKTDEPPAKSDGTNHPPSVASSGREPTRSTSRRTHTGALAKRK